MPKKKEDRGQVQEKMSLEMCEFVWSTQTACVCVYVCDAVQKAMLSSRVNHLVLLVWLQTCPFPCNSVNVKLADSGGVCACICVCALNITGSVLRFSNPLWPSDCPFLYAQIFAQSSALEPTGQFIQLETKQVQISLFTQASSVYKWAGNRRFYNTEESTALVWSQGSTLRIFSTGPVLGQSLLGQNFHWAHHKKVMK